MSVASACALLRRIGLQTEAELGAASETASSDAFDRFPAPAPSPPASPAHTHTDVVLPTAAAPPSPADITERRPSQPSQPSSSASCLGLQRLYLSVRHELAGVRAALLDGGGGCDRGVDGFLDLLLDVLPGRLLPAFSDADRVRLFEWFVVHCDGQPPNPVSVCVRFTALAGAVSRRLHTDVLLPLLGRIVQSDEFSDVLPRLVAASAPSAPPTARSHHTLTLWLTLPDRAANAEGRGSTRTRATKSLHPSGYYRQTCQHAVTAVLASPVGHSVVVDVMARLCRRGRVRDIARAWKHASVCATRFPDLIAAVPSDAVESLLVTLVSDLPTNPPPRLQSVFGAFDRLPTACQRVVSNQLPLRHVWPAAVTKSIVKYGVGDAAAVDIASVWADPWFMDNSDISLQASVTRVVLDCVRSVDMSMLSGESRLLMALLDGVQTRLGSRSEPVRRHGMGVAEEFSKRLTPEDPLTFGKTDVEDEAREVEAEAAEVVGEVEVEVVEDHDAGGVEETKEDVSAVRHKPLIRPPTDTCVHYFDTESDSEVSSEDEADDGDHMDGDALSVSSSGSLQPYAIDDESEASGDEDGAPSAPKPVLPSYLRDAIGAVRHKDDFRLATSTLAGLAGLVRSTAASPASRHQVTDCAVPLLRTLLGLENRFAVPDAEFFKWRSDAVVEVVKAEPKRAADYLAREFYNSEQSDGVRHEVLEMLVTAARDLSGTHTSAQRQKDREDLKDRADAAGVSVSPPPALPSKPTDGGRTRRWGQRKTPIPESKPNLFASMASWFFMPLINGLRRHGKRFSSRPLVLGDLVRSLGVLLECGRLSPDVPRLARHLFELLWALRFNDDLGLRRSVLMSLGAVVAAVGRWHLLHDSSPNTAGATLQDDLREAGAWLATVKTADPDPLCREMATRLLASSILRDAGGLGQVMWSGGGGGKPTLLR